MTRPTNALPMPRAMADVACDARPPLAAPGEELERGLEQHRGELTAHCHRMLGSRFEAEDAVQETLVRAWRGYERFEGRSSLRSWVYKIATNVCLDMVSDRERRALPMDLSSVRSPDGSIGGARPEARWVEPLSDGPAMAPEADPAAVAVSRETVRLAFVAALQHLPPRQRAVLILCEVLRWQASEVAELLEASVASVTSALQRARARLVAHDLEPGEGSLPLDGGQRALLARYVDAFERYDTQALTSLLREDATLSMPPAEPSPSPPDDTPPPNRR